jgi:hypothetical protein
MSISFTVGALPTKTEMLDTGKECIAWPTIRVRWLMKSVKQQSAGLDRCVCILQTVACAGLLKPLASLCARSCVFCYRHVYRILCLFHCLWNGCMDDIWVSEIWKERIMVFWCGKYGMRPNGIRRMCHILLLNVPSLQSFWEPVWYQECQCLYGWYGYFGSIVAMVIDGPLFSGYHDDVYYESWNILMLTSATGVYRFLCLRTGSVSPCWLPVFCCKIKWNEKLFRF